MARRALAVVAVSAVFGQHGLELAHALTVEHVRCAEHGELLDVSRSPASGAPQAPGLSESASSEERHDHCAVDWLSRCEAATPDPAFDLTQLQHEVAGLAPSSAAQLFTVLRYAPKTSPPIS